MCGRFTLTTPTDELTDYFRVLEDGRLPARGRLGPRYNIAPTQPVLCVRRSFPADGGAPEVSGGYGERRPASALVTMRWGLIPYWAKDPAIGGRMINARAETVAEKPAYREAFRRRRCLLAADGFYEWQALGTGKQPYFIHLRDRRPFAFAGLWERWRPRGDQLDEIAAPGKPEVPLSDDGRVESCALLTTEPNDLMRRIHDRMPLILPRQHWETWLDPEIDDIAVLGGLLTPYPGDDMCAYPVGSHVNKPANDDPACIEPLKTVRIIRPATTEGDDAPDPERPTLPRQDSLF